MARTATKTAKETKKTNTTVKEIKTMAKGSTRTKKTTTKTNTTRNAKKETSKTEIKKATVTLEFIGSIEKLEELKKAIENLGIETKTIKPCKTISNEEFNRDLYVQLAKELGVLGLHGVYKFARPVIYKAMAEKTITPTKIKNYRKEIEKLAKADEKISKWFFENTKAVNAK